MKSYYIYQENIKTGEERVIKVNGYLYTDKFGRLYGARKIIGIWEVTEINSGLLVNSLSTILKRAEIQDYINSVSERVDNLLTNSEHHIKLIQRFNELKRKAQEDENGNI